MKDSGKKPWLYLPFILIFSFMLNLYLGSVHIPLSDLAGILFGKNPENPVWSDIIWQFRMTKALTCVLAGASLSMAGLAMQTLFRNALAGPDVLGISSGASLAVSLIVMGQAAWLPAIATGPWTIAGAASAGGSIILLLVFAISRRLRDNNSLLIIGLMIGATVTSLVSVLQYISNADDQQAYLIWTFGSLGGLNYSEIGVLSMILTVAAITLAFASKSMNAWLLGDNYAASLGVDAQSARMFMIVAACVLTGAVTAFCGPIAFVGLAVPHFSRIMFKTHDHMVLLPAVLVNGAILLLLCDVAAQLPGTAYVLPINAITALVGAPAVISIVMRARQVSL